MTYPSPLSGWPSMIMSTSTSLPSCSVEMLEALALSDCKPGDFDVNAFAEVEPRCTFEPLNCHCIDDGVRLLRNEKCDLVVKHLV